MNMVNTEMKFDEEKKNYLKMREENKTKRSIFLFYLLFDFKRANRKLNCFGKKNDKKNEFWKDDFFFFFGFSMNLKMMLNLSLFDCKM